MSKILYSSGQIRKEIIKLFSSPKCRRVAIAAFVGDGVESYLPNPKRLHLICWPKAGGTNPHALRHLIKRDVKISFVDNLHMKLYWAEGRGAIITSANLSTNALGAGDLKEVGILISSKEVDIDKIISSLKLRNSTEAELQKLDRLHDSYARKNNSPRQKSQLPSFKQWYQSFARRSWKFGWADTHGNFSRNTVDIVKRDYGIKPYTFISCKYKDYKKGDWILYFMFEINSIRTINWLFVDYIVPVSKTDPVYYHRYPYQAVQINVPKHYPIPSFVIDKAFRKSFRKAISEFGGVEEIQKLKSVNLPKKFVESIYKNYI